MSEKAKTNKKWVSNTDYRRHYDKIFKKSKPEYTPEKEWLDEEVRLEPTTFLLRNGEVVSRWSGGKKL
jgi:hypothetical protein